jgi:hypothetical protein
MNPHKGRQQPTAHLTPRPQQFSGGIRASATLSGSLLRLVGRFHVRRTPGNNAARRKWAGLSGFHALVVAQVDWWTQGRGYFGKSQPFRVPGADFYSNFLVLSLDPSLPR